MHPDISKFYEKIKEIIPSQILNAKVLILLKKHGATSTETIIMLHLGFKLDMNEVENFVFNSQIWDPEDPNDILYQTMKYMYYDENSNYEADDDRIKISI